MLRMLWNDEAGAVFSMEIVLVATILVIGLIVGLASVRNSVVLELGDVAQAISDLSQSYSYGVVKGHHAFTDGGEFQDQRDFCDDPNGSEQCNSKCIEVCATPPQGEAPHDGQTGP